MEVAENTATTEPAMDITVHDVNMVVRTAGALVSRLQPDEVPSSWAEGIWVAFDRLERLAAGAKTLMADRLAESQAWKRAGFAHPAEYMAVRSGTSVTSARETLAASRRLDELPATASLLREGALSVPQAQHITDAASHNPDAEADLLGMATDGSSLHELRDACGRAKAAADKDPESRKERLHAQRRLRQRRETDGAWSLWAQGTLTDAAVFNAAVEEIIDGLLQDAHDRGEQLTREQAAYDALIEMANRIVTTDWTDNHDQDDLSTPADGTDPAAGGTADDEPAEPADSAGASHQSPVGVPETTEHKNRKKRPRRKAQPYLGIVRADLAALRRGHPEGDEVVEIAGLGPISVAEARQILGGDSVLQLVLTNGVAANVTNFRRSPNTAQRMALLAQMPCCSVKGCPRTWVQIDHRRDWATTRITRLEDLDPLCYWHHQLKTLYGWALVPGVGKRDFVPPRDPQHPANQGDDASPRTAERAAVVGDRRDVAALEDSVPAPAAPDGCGPDGHQTSRLPPGRRPRATPQTVSANGRRPPASVARQVVPV